MKHWAGLVALATVSLVVAACASEDSGPVENTTGIPDACNPLGGPACLMPWPSALYLEDDDSTASGVRVALPTEAMQVNADGVVVDPEMLNAYDGFGVVAPILVAFDGGVSADGLPPHTDPAVSVSAESSIVVVNMDTGERLTLFAEPDMNADEPEERALVIRPLERMRPASRYAVGVRKTVRAADGSPLAVPPGFAALVAGDDFPHPLFAKIAPRYDAIFAALEAEGVSRDDLLVAWDFVTASDEMLTSDLLAMREQALPEIGERGANLGFEAEEIDGNPDRVYRLLVGEYDVPMFLDAGETDPSVLQRDAAGRPELVGMGRANFSAVIPRCVETAQLPVPVIIFGHGLFGNAQDYIDDRFLQEVAQDNCVVIIGGDWIGLTNRQIAAAAFAVNNLNRGPGITEKLAQAVINFIALQRITRGPFRDSPLFQVDGVPVLDPDQVHYYGASLGGIMGGTFMSYDPDIELGALGVAGGPWSLLFERSLAWPPLRVAMKAAYTNSPWDYQLNLSMMGMMFEKVDPMTTARRVINDPLPGTPAKQLFVYMAMGDTLVNNPASDALIRTLDIAVCGPSLRVPFAVREDLAPATSAASIYDEGVAPWPPSTNVAPEDDNGTHGDVNERNAVQRQVQYFFRNRMVRNECRDGDTPAPCDCSLGVCD